MLYLLDANVLITAHNTYYPLDQVPEFWNWILHQASLGLLKMPLEIVNEVASGDKEGDLLLPWIKDPKNKSDLILQESVTPAEVSRVVASAYGEDLTDSEIEAIGRDPFLVAYGLRAPDRCVVTTEVSKPKKLRHNRHLPDVCGDFNLPWCNTFELNRKLGFRTSWKP